MKITLIGMGSGTPASLTAAGRDALLDAELILGASRLLEQLPAECTPDRAALYKAQEICARLQCADIDAAAVVFSGDTGFTRGHQRSAVPLMRQDCPIRWSREYPVCSFWRRRCTAPGRTGSWSALTAAAVTLRRSAATESPSFS